MNATREALRYHVTGAIERGEQVAVTNRVAKPLPLVRAGYLPRTEWPRSVVAARLREARANGTAQRCAAGVYIIHPYTILTRTGGPQA